MLRRHVVVQEVRVRFAPSPTGPLHIGGLRTALYNHLFAKKNGGRFVLRIEDTDSKRLVEGTEQYIFDALRWCGIAVDEGPTQGGDYGPYRQSERGDIYRKHIQVLLERGKAYYAFDTPEALHTMRLQLQKKKALHQHYGVHTRLSMQNSLILSAQEVTKRLAKGMYVIRLKMEERTDVQVKDSLRGVFSVRSDTLDDKVLIKADGTPTYHFANVVDDYEMRITHVLRGEEWLSSLPVHACLHRYMGWEQNMPAYTHLPLILKPDGQGKLSKRTVGSHPFPMYPLPWKEQSICSFKEAGYLPEALCNFLALLGWHPQGTNEELLTIEEMADAFALQDLSKMGARWDIKKALWFNGKYLKKTPTKDLARLLLDNHAEVCQGRKEEEVVASCDMMKDRVSLLPDIIKESQYETATSSVDALELTSAVVSGLKVFVEKGAEKKDAKTLKEEYMQALKHHKAHPGAGMRALRRCLTGRDSGPDLTKIIAYLGSKKACSKVRAALGDIAYS